MALTGYRIDRYIDVNPKSPTYNTTKDERVADTACTEGEPVWEKVLEYCETDYSGAKTGNLITVYINSNKNSSTYGTTKTETTVDTVTCPPPSTDPDWIEDPTFDTYCEEIYYEPSHTLGYSGKRIVRMVDNNIYSPTYKQTSMSAVTDTESCPPPNTEPIIQEFSYECELDENLQPTGYALRTGLDRNVYSSTYLSTVTTRELDERCGGVSCNCDDLVVLDNCNCDDLSVLDDVTEFGEMLDKFNKILVSRGNTKVSSGTTLYRYLENSYNAAVAEYNGDSMLFDRDTYSEVFRNGVSQWGSNATYENDGTGLKAMTSWLMAMQLSEIYAESGHSTNNQTELFKAAYDLFEGEHYGRTIPLYGNYTLKGDVTICRLAASAMYSRLRSQYSYSQMDDMRTSVGRTVNNRNSDWTDLGQDTWATCDGNYDARNTMGYSSNLYDIFPSPAGPFATNYYYCAVDQVAPARTYPSEQPSSQFNQTTKNYVFDETVDAYVVAHYNLFANDVDLKRTVQAVADEADDVLHMFGNPTYYKYTQNRPKDSFIVGTPTDNNGSFNGTFSCQVTGKDLSSLLSTAGGSDTNLSKFFKGVISMGGRTRKTILDPQWGRRRPGQGEKDAELIQSTRYATARCVCGNGLPNGCTNCTDTACTSQNFLSDFSIVRLVGTGTKYDEQGNPHRYYVDMDGDGYWDSGEPYYGDTPSGSDNLCAGLHASTYPSGHSSEVWSVALFLMMMMPDKWAEIYKAAYDFTVSRTIKRAHWNSDIMYGKLVATTIVPVMNSFGNSTDGQFRTLYQNAFNAITGATDGCPSEEHQTMRVNIRVQNNRSIQVVLRRKIKITLENDNHYGWDGCYNNITLFDYNTSVTIPAKGYIDYNNIEVDSTNWTTTRHFLDVSSCQLFRTAYPTNTNVWVYTPDNDGQAIIPQGISPSTAFVDGGTYIININ